MRALSIIFLLSLFTGIWGCFTIKVSDKKEQSHSFAETPAKEEEKTGWKDTLADIAGNVFLGTEKGIVFYAFDVLTPPNRPVKLRARLQRAKLLRDIPGVSAAFYHDGQLIQKASSDDDGWIEASWLPPKVGDYEFTVHIIDGAEAENADLQQITPVSLLVSVRTKDTPFVVIDLDHTVVDSSFFYVLLGRGKPMADSVRVTHHLARRYSLIYLTHRPDLLTHLSKTWLKKHGYPRGPLFVSKISEALGSSGKFKTASLDELRNVFTNIQIGIGDKLSDAQAYVDNNMIAYLIPHYDKEPDDMRDMAQDILDLRDPGRLNVVSGWRQIENGIFQGQKYSPQTFAENLKTQAHQLEVSKKHDDD